MPEVTGLRVEMGLIRCLQSCAYAKLECLGSRTVGTAVLSWCCHLETRQRIVETDLSLLSSPASIYTS